MAQRICGTGQAWRQEDLLANDCSTQQEVMFTVSEIMEIIIPETLIGNESKSYSGGLDSGWERKKVNGR